MSALPPLSALAKYDDLMRCSKELTAGIAEEKFMLFLHQFEIMKAEYQRLVTDARDTQARLDDQTLQMMSLERKLDYARKMLTQEQKARKQAESEKYALETKLESLKSLLVNDNTMRDETRKQLQVLSSYCKKRKSTHQHIEEDEAGNDINSTGSFLSDLSLTQSGDDILDPKPSGFNQKWKKHRPSTNIDNSGFLNVSGKKKRTSMEKRRSTRQSILEYGPADKIISQTKVTIPNDKRAPIYAESKIESIPNVYPTPSTSSDEMAMGGHADYFVTPQRQKSNDQFKTPNRVNPSTLFSNKKFYTPSAPSLDDLDNIRSADVYATVKKNPAAVSSPIANRLHKFTSKTCLKSEICGCCSKKVRFGSQFYKCSECRTSVHADCRERFNVNCLPQISTPVASKGGSTISDFAPSLAPMVPALIVHCVNEIETRGLTEVGLYRISGSERDVKALKEKFLRNNGIPNLSEVDVHVMCGCVKDFLRSLRERLVPLSLWVEFSNAAQNAPSDDDLGGVNRDMYRAVEKLPQPNRDTLAYLILHFQRISEYPEVKMPLTNFAKIFGPTIVGYSCADPDQHMMFAETQVQFTVMFALLNIPTDYWQKFIVLDKITKSEEQKEIDTYGRKFYSGTPSIKFPRKDRKFYNTPPYSAINKKKKEKFEESESESP